MVVLKSPRPHDKHYLHRYFKIGNDWQVSVDEKGGVDTILKALARLYLCKIPEVVEAHTE